MLPFIAPLKCFKSAFKNTNQHLYKLVLKAITQVLRNYYAIITQLIINQNTLLALTYALTQLNSPTTAQPSLGWQQ